jgi:hypothetical protein
MSGLDFGMLRGHSGTMAARYNLGLAALEQYNKTSNQKETQEAPSSPNNQRSSRQVSFG